MDQQPPVAKPLFVSVDSMESLFDLAARSRHFNTSKVLIGRIILVSRVLATESEERNGIGGMS